MRERKEREKKRGEEGSFAGGRTGQVERKEKERIEREREGASYV